MVGGILKKAGKVLKAVKKTKDSTFMKRRKTLAGVSGVSEAIPSWFKKWLKDNPSPRGTPGPKIKKKVASDFVKRRKKMGGPKSYKIK
jgi:hypothetical protein